MSRCALVLRSEGNAGNIGALSARCIITVEHKIIDIAIVTILQRGLDLVAAAYAAHFG